MNIFVILMLVFSYGWAYADTSDYEAKETQQVCILIHKDSAVDFSQRGLNGELLNQPAQETIDKLEALQAELAAEEENTENTLDQVNQAVRYDLNNMDDYLEDPKNFQKVCLLKVSENM